MFNVNGLDLIVTASAELNDVLLSLFVVRWLYFVGVVSLSVAAVRLSVCVCLCAATL